MIYESEKILEAFNNLSTEYKKKASTYIKNLLTIQRAERRITHKAEMGEKELREEFEELGALLGEGLLPEQDGKIHCSFCKKSQDDCHKLIAGPGHVFICDECIDICAEIMEEETKREKNQAGDDKE